MKGKRFFGYKFLFFIALAAAIANAAARSYRPFFAYFVPGPDTTTSDTSVTKNDSLRKLRFPIYDQTGDPMTDLQRPKSIDLADPANVNKNFEYNQDSNRFEYQSRLGSEFLRNPTYLTLDEYLKYRATEEQNAYWQRRQEGLMLFNKTPELPPMYKEGLFDRIFGSSTIQVKPQGNVDVTFGGNWQNIKNPTLTQRAQKYGVFDFDMQMNINLLATVGDKLKLNISNNTKATFDYQNLQRIDYSGKEDEMLKKIEAGNVSFPLKSNLINGVQSLFGLKTQLQFGKLWVTAVVSQQKSQKKSLTIQGGTQAQQIAIKAYNYEENKNFLLAQYFRNNYDNAMKNFPVVNSHVIINRVEVWVTNKTGVVTGTRKALCFMDLGEATPNKPSLTNPNTPIRYGLPDNNSNVLYSLLQQNPAGRAQSSAINALDRLGLVQQEDYDYTTARQLSASEFSFNPQLGYIMLNTQMNPDDVVGVAYRYTYKGKVYQVGEFASDLPPDTANQKVLFLKLLKGTSPRTTLPVWKLMMKNIYALGGFGISRENFSLNIYYQDPGGGEKRYMPEGKYEGTPFINLLNLDRLNAQNEPQPDGVFDFVEGMTINTQQGKIIFPVLEPFGNGLKYATDNNQVLEKKYIYQTLYDSTKFVAQQSQRNDRFIMRGTYKSSSSSEIFLGGFNIPPGSVSVSAGGTKLVENQDYQIEYGLGRIKILNTGILNSGVPINIQYEDNATFGFQQQNFMATRLDYYVNKNLTIGSTIMRLRERPYTQKVNFGEDPIQNTVIGFDANYQSEVAAITRLVDKLPVYSTTAPSFLNTNAEVAGILPGHPKQIEQGGLDPDGAVYIDDFEGTSSNYDLKFPAQSWSLASTPRGAINKFGQPILPEANLSNDLSNGKNRARLAWYTIEPTLIDPGVGGVPEYVKKDPNQHYIRMVQVQDVFPYRSTQTLQTALNTFDLGYYPKERGPYNFDATNIDPVSGELLNPSIRWGGITRSIDNTDFEASNVQYIQFWVMDPFIGRPANYPGGSLYINLGNVSEDIMRDSRMFFENCIPSPFDPSKLDTSAWGYVPRFEQQITRAFDNDNAARLLQDVGYDGLSDEADPGRESEHTKFGKFLAQLRLKLGAANPAFLQVDADPANDNFRFYRDSAFNGSNSDQISVLTRYKRYNSPHGNSPITAANAAFTSMGTSIPESEDINRDNTLNESESYFQYRIDLKPDMKVGENYLINIQNSITPGGIKMPNGTTEPERWYQFKIPIQDYDHKIGGISDFRSIRFMRMFLNGWEDSVILRFATLELGRNQWRNYRYSLTTPGENLPQQNQGLTDFTVTSVSIEENAYRDPVPYAIPPGVNRQVVAGTNATQSLQLNEQSLSLRACALQDGDARGVFKEVNVDMRQFSYLRMFIHAESMIGQVPINNGDVDAFIRIGSDFTNNYYEYHVPLAVSQRGITAPDAIWPAANQVNVLLQDLVNAKKERDALYEAKGISDQIPYTTKDSKGNEIVVIGTPNLGGAKNIMLGLLNPKKSNQRLGDDGLPKCLEVWFDEMRLAGLSDRAGYAAAGKVSVQMADLGNVNLSGSMHTQGYGNIDQKILQRSQDDYYQYNASSNLNMGKLAPRNWGVQLPLFVGYTESVSTPRYNPYDQDVELKDALDVLNTVKKRDSLRSAAQDYTSITSFNLTNVRIQGNPANVGKAKAPWSIKNFDFTYSYNRQFKHNPLIESDNLVTQRLGIGYTYSLKTRPIEPFKSSIKSKSKWLALIKDFNLTPLPSTFSHRSDLNRIFQETHVRNLDEGTTFRLPPNFYKNFTWTRTYNLRWELMKSISLDYSAVNISRINEPYGRIDTKEKRDSLWRNVRSFGLNNSYSQTFNSSYNVPLAKLPLTDWMNLRLNYSATYSWLTAPPVAHSLGNTLSNTQTKTVAGDMNFAQLYNKSKLLRAINAKPATNKKDDKLAPSVGGVEKEKEPGVKKGKALPGAKLSGVNDDGKNPEDDGGKKDGSKSGKKDDNKSDTTKSSNSKLDNPAFVGINTENMTDAQLDSVIKAFKAADKAKAKEEKKKKKAARKAARKARHGKTPELTPAEQAIGQFVTMLNRATINYTETGGTVLPGYMDSTRFMGINNYSGAPGLDFVYGYQPGYDWLAMQAAAGRLSRDSLFNTQLQQTFSSNLNATASVQPAKDLRIDLNLTKAFAKSHNELYADTTYSGFGPFEHLNPYETGSFNITYISLYSMFRSTDVNSAVYKQFLSNRTVISQRLGRSNPYTNGLPDPANPGYAKGYGPFSQDVLVPSFISAYSGTQSGTTALIDYSHSRLRDNPFRYFTPVPNWKVTYNGLTKIPSFASVFTSFVVNHGYTGTLAMNSFNSSLLYGDLYGLGFPSFIDSNSQNYIPYFQSPNITMTQAFTPLIGFDAAFKSNLTARFEVRKSKSQSLSLIDYQVGENVSTEYVIGIGFRKKGVKLPFEAFGVRKLKNELICKFDISIRDDKSTNTFLSNNVSVTSRGQKVIRVSPTIDYSINKNLTLRIFYDRQQTLPYVSNSFPSTTTRAGITLRFIFAQ